MQDIYYTTPDMLQLFQTTPQTLNNWAKKYPLLRPQKLGKSNVYKKENVQKHLENLPISTAYLTPQEIREKAK